MNLEEWRKGEEYVLPSGLVVRLKRVSLLDLVTQGQIPVTLTAQTEALIDSGRFKIASFQEFAPVLDLLVRACVKEPPIADVPDEGHVGINEVSVDDKLAIFAWATSEVSLMKKFRQEQDAAVDAV